jgi:hypothetical protein
MFEVALETTVQLQETGEVIFGFLVRYDGTVTWLVLLRQFNKNIKYPLHSPILLSKHSSLWHPSVFFPIEFWFVMRQNLINAPQMALYLAKYRLVSIIQDPYRKFRSPDKYSGFLFSIQGSWIIIRNYDRANMSPTHAPCGIPWQVVDNCRLSAQDRNSTSSLQSITGYISGSCSFQHQSPTSIFFIIRPHAGPEQEPTDRFP